MSASVAMVLWVVAAIYCGIGFAIGFGFALKATLDGDSWSVLRALAVVAIWPVFFIGGDE